MESKGRLRGLVVAITGASAGIGHETARLAAREGASVVLSVGVDTEFRAAIRQNFGWIARGGGPKQDVATVARAIADCIVRPRAEVYTYPKAWWIALLNVIAPARTDRFIQRFTREATRVGDKGDASVS